MSSYTDWKYSKAGIAGRLRRAKERLKPWAEKGVKTVAVQGTSGIWLAPGLISAGFNVLLVRKPGEGSHGFPVEPTQYNANRRPVVIVDDFVSSGQTVRRMVESLILNTPHHVVGIVIHDPYSIDVDVSLGADLPGFSEGWVRPTYQREVIGGDHRTYEPQEPSQPHVATQVSPDP